MRLQQEERGTHLYVEEVARIYMRRNVARKLLFPQRFAHALKLPRISPQILCTYEAGLNVHLALAVS